MVGRKYLYNEYSDFNIKRNNVTKQRRYMFYVAITDTQLYDTSTNKTTEISIKITFKKMYLQRKEL